RAAIPHHRTPRPHAGAAVPRARTHAQPREHAPGGGGRRGDEPGRSRVLARHGDAPQEPAPRAHRAPRPAHRAPPARSGALSERLIERWLPIAALGIESLRERTPMTPFPAPNRLHVWWPRRPLVASRAAVLASLLPADADRERFMRILGIHGDPVATRRRIDAARRSGIRFEGEAYGYDRAFKYVPTDGERVWLRHEISRVA